MSTKKEGKLVSMMKDPKLQKMLQQKHLENQKKKRASEANRGKQQNSVMRVRNIKPISVVGVFPSGKDPSYVLKKNKPGNFFERCNRIQKEKANAARKPSLK